MSPDTEKEERSSMGNQDSYAKTVTFARVLLIYLFSLESMLVRIRKRKAARGEVGTKPCAVLSI